MKVIILAAGKGRRLGPLQSPKPLTKLANGKSILSCQIDHLLKHFSVHDILIVVGYKKELIMEAFPDLGFVYSPGYEEENTSQSLLRALYKVEDEDLLFLNGDVVFKESVLKQLLSSKNSSLLVSETEVSEEEVKYDLKDDGSIRNISKEVKNPLGEALGINLIKKEDLPLLKETLKLCLPNDYFEKGIELAIGEGLKIYPTVVSKENCMEIDFPKDLEKANVIMKDW